MGTFNNYNKIFQSFKALVLRRVLQFMVILKNKKYNVKNNALKFYPLGLSQIFTYLVAYFYNAMSITANKRLAGKKFGVVKKYCSY